MRSKKSTFPLSLLLCGAIPFSIYAQENKDQDVEKNHEEIAEDLGLLTSYQLGKKITDRLTSLSAEDLKNWTFADSG